MPLKDIDVFKAIDGTVLPSVTFHDGWGNYSFLIKGTPTAEVLSLKVPTYTSSNPEFESAKVGRTTLDDLAFLICRGKVPRTTLIKGVPKVVVRPDDTLYPVLVMLCSKEEKVIVAKAFIDCIERYHKGVTYKANCVTEASPIAAYSPAGTLVALFTPLNIAQGEILTPLEAAKQRLEKKKGGNHA